MEYAVFLLEYYALQQTSRCGLNGACDLIRFSIRD